MYFQILQIGFWHSKAVADYLSAEDYANQMQPKEVDRSYGIGCINITWQPGFQPVYPYETSWTFGSCKSPTIEFEPPWEYDDDGIPIPKDYILQKDPVQTECCQQVGNYDLICEDNYWDGWVWGYVQE